MGNASKQTNIERRRRLSALYEKGKIIRFGPDGEVDGEPTSNDIEIFVGPPSPLHREMAVREAQAIRARAMLSVRKESDSEEYLSSASFIASMDDDAIVNYLVNFGDAERLSEARRTVLSRPEWDDFNALRDSMQQFEDAGSPYDDPEWEFLLKRDQQFGDQLDVVVKELKEASREGFKLMGRGDLEKKSLDRRIEAVGSAAFMKAYEDCMLFYACRTPEDHTELFFDSVADMKSQPDEVTDALQQALATYITEAAEAKNSLAAGSGSASSVMPKEPETSSPSTPEDAIGF